MTTTEQLRSLNRPLLLQSGTMPSVLLFFVLQSILIVPRHAVSIRYTLLPNNIVGKFVEKGEVGHVNDCTAIAARENCVAFRIEYRNQEILCSLVTDFEKFSKRVGYEVLDYILDTQMDDNVCRPDAKRNVLNIISGQCILSKEACAMLEKIKSNCIAIGRDATSCIPRCPTGFGFKESFKRCVGVFPFARNISLSPHNEVNSQCSAKSSSVLVTIENDRQNSDIVDLTPDGRGVVIGLRIPRGQTWSLGAFAWADGSAATYRNWASPGEPGNQGKNEYFVVLLRHTGFGGRWGDSGVGYAAGEKAGFVACMLEASF